jgi:hypothetical protein
MKKHMLFYIKIILCLMYRNLYKYTKYKIKKTSMLNIFLLENNI